MPSSSGPWKFGLLAAGVLALVVAIKVLEDSTPDGSSDSAVSSATSAEPQNQNLSGTLPAFASNIPAGDWRFAGVTSGIPFWISTDKPKRVGQSLVEIQLIQYDASLPPIVWQQSRWYVDCRTRSTREASESLLDSHYRPTKAGHLKSGNVDDEMSADYVPGSEDAEVAKAACSGSP